MRLIISILVIALLSFGVELLWPWWTIAVVAFLVSLFAALRPGQGFLAGFAGVGLLWLVVALVIDIRNAHILSQRLAALFKLPNYALFICVSALVGALVGGLSGWSAAALRRSFTR